MGKRELFAIIAAVFCTLFFTACNDPISIDNEPGGTDTVYVHDTATVVSFDSAWTWNFFSNTTHDGANWRMWSPVVSSGMTGRELFLAHRDSTRWIPYDTVKLSYAIGYSGQNWEDGYQILLADPGKLMQNWKWKIVILTE